MTLNYLLKNWVNNELRCRLCALALFFAVFFFPFFLFSASLSSSLSGCVTAPPLCSFPSPLHASPSTIIQQCFGCVFCLLLPWLMAHPDSRFWVRDSVHMVSFSWQVLLPPSFQQYVGKKWLLPFQKWDLPLAQRYVPHSWPCYGLAALGAHRLDSKRSQWGVDAIFRQGV